MYFIGVILDSKNFENIKTEVKKYKEKIRLIKINTKTIENLQNIKFDLIILNNELDKFNKQEQILKKICQNAKYIALNVAGIIMTIVAMILGIKYKDKLSIAIGIGVLVGLIIGLIATIFILNRYDLFL